jgi:hypothetical protein
MRCSWVHFVAPPAQAAYVALRSRPHIERRLDVAPRRTTTAATEYTETATEKTQIRLPPEASRTAWKQSLKRIADLHPAIVVAGHKKDVSSPDSPDVLAFMDRYLTDFDVFRKSSSSGPELLAAMRGKYPDLAIPGLLGYAARMAYQKAPPAF